MFIRKIFWPVVTFIFFLVVMIVWFGGGLAQRQRTAQLTELMTQYEWFSYDLKGSSVILRGLAPDRETQEKLIHIVRAMESIDTITSQIILPKNSENKGLILTLSKDSLTLSGPLPINIDRFDFIHQIEQLKPGFIIYDEMDSSTISDDDRFEPELRIMTTLLPKMTLGVLEVSDEHVATDEATQKMIKTMNLSHLSLILDDKCIWLLNENEQWYKSCHQPD
ncbi:hypothetical protein [Bartonella tamiae]|uniref:BON domain-containing protein n=1 Tax=Bartonella tamiae Th239 TaxID=1094558 RepID=J0R4M7_9HYPH|nr:hypothetical protein [Bartonella tamiae]EJF90619.1 hypothetical protein ME5_01020 [Bartonella tamiae Th239]EJF94004.1 hypothetical protein MEG_00862 [Bartonella tamiae Th307]